MAKDSMSSIRRWLSAMMTTTSALPGLYATGIPASTTTFALYEAVTSGSSTGFGIASNYGATIVCHAHHT